MTLRINNISLEPLLDGLFSIFSLQSFRTEFRSKKAQKKNDRIRMDTKNGRIQLDLKNLRSYSIQMDLIQSILNPKPLFNPIRPLLRSKLFSREYIFQNFLNFFRFDGWFNSKIRSTQLLDQAKLAQRCFRNPSEKIGSFDMSDQYYLETPCRWFILIYRNTKNSTFLTHSTDTFGKLKGFLKSTKTMMSI